jgi:Mce-associated membrane protein
VSTPRTSARRPVRALIALGAVVVVVGVLVAGLCRLDHHNGQVDAARQAALQAAREQVVTVLSTEQLSAPAAPQPRIVTRAEVIDSAVVRAEPDEVVVLLFVNQRTQSSPSGVVQLSAHRIELTMTRVDDRWLISELERV